MRGHPTTRSKASAAQSFKSCPREGASRDILPTECDVMSFKSCPREGASISSKGSWGVTPVSSHAPVRGHRLRCLLIWVPLCFKSCPREGASYFNHVPRLPYAVSSHAPVRGHLYLWRSTPSLIVFQVMPPQGGISKRLFLSAGNTTVSSHAPVRGHLHRPNPQNMPAYRFKSCPREGASHILRLLRFRSKFQVMPP